jgi:hypothetical protein
VISLTAEQRQQIAKSKAGAEEVREANGGKQSSKRIVAGNGTIPSLSESCLHVSDLGSCALTINNALSDVNCTLSAQTVPGGSFAIKRACDATEQDRFTAKALLKHEFGFNQSNMDKWVEDQPKPNHNGIVLVCLLAFVLDKGTRTVAGVTILAFSTKATAGIYQQPCEVVILATQLAYQRRGIARLLICVAADVGKLLGCQVLVVDSTLATEQVWKRKHFLGQGKHLMPLAKTVTKLANGAKRVLVPVSDGVVCRLQLRLLTGQMFTDVRYLVHEYTVSNFSRCSTSCTSFSSHAISKLRARTASLPIEDTNLAKRTRDDVAEEEGGGMGEEEGGGMGEKPKQPKQQKIET